MQLLKTLSDIIIILFLIKYVDIIISIHTNDRRDVVKSVFFYEVVPPYRFEVVTFKAIGAMFIGRYKIAITFLSIFSCRPVIIILLRKYVELVYHCFLTNDKQTIHPVIDVIIILRI